MTSSNSHRCSYWVVTYCFVFEGGLRSGMPIVAVPQWDARGLLPPCNSASPVSSDRSPYRVSLQEVVLDFAITSERVDILKGFLQYRAALHALGIVKGFQWLDGSFFENIEMLEKRAPGDIDVVTFHEMPLGHTQMTLKQANPSLFPVTGGERTALKNLMKVDAYTQSLSANPALLVGRSAYWYSIWSHRRDLTWKGYVEVDLSPVEDAQASSALAALPPQPSTPPGGQALVAPGGQP